LGWLHLIIGRIVTLAGFFALFRVAAWAPGGGDLHGAGLCERDLQGYPLLFVVGAPDLLDRRPRNLAADRAQPHALGGLL